MNDKVR